MSGRGGRGGGRGEGGRGGGRGEGGRGGGRGEGGRGGGRGDGGRGRGGGFAGAVAGGRSGGYAGPVAGGRGYDAAGRGGSVAGYGVGRGYAAAAGYGDQPTLAQSYGRGGVNVMSQPPPMTQPPPVAQPVAPAPSVASSSSPVEAVTEDVEKLTLGSQSVQKPPEMETAVVKVPTSSKRYGVALRPSYGREGRKCVIRANHFLVKVADNDLHHYDVTIRPEVTNKKVCREIMKNLDVTFRTSLLGNRQIAYDGSKSIYTAGELPFVSKDFVVKLEDKDRGARREREFKVSIKFASKPDVHHLKQFLASKQLDMPHETIQLFDVVLRAKPSEDYTVFGRSFFSVNFGAGELGDGLEFWKGFYQSLRPTQMGLSLNIDMSATAFHEPVMVSEFVEKLLRKDFRRGFTLTNQEQTKVRKSLRGMRVEFRHGEYMRRYKVLSISTPPLSQLTFEDETGGRISVAHYFQNKYQINLSYAFLPALNAGNDAKPTYLPMEVCRIVEGQRCSKKLNEKQVTNLLRATCQRPRERELSINKVAGENRYNNNTLVREFGIQVGTEMACIDARVLNPPKLKYHASSRQAVIEPRVGQWNMIDKRMFNGGRVDLWTCINFSRCKSDVVDRFCGDLIRMCSNRGIEFNPQPLIPIQPGDSRAIDKALIGLSKQCESRLQDTGKQLQLLIVVLPDASGSYGSIKRTCETRLGIVSQCCQPRHVFKCSPQYLENLSLKINVKVGGRNALLVNAPPFIRDYATIIFGADVTHPSPGEDSSPSIAAVVASMDWPDVTKYRALYSAQGHREEIIRDLYSTQVTEKNVVVHGGMIRDHLRAFYGATRRRPDRIIFYRDGVSEGQFNQVLLEEMDAIRKACQSLQEDYLPPVTFVVVQKRHHTRLFPANHGDKNLTDKSGNILPGTVVDTSICHPTEFDFYLCSHAGIQGTSRPTHYHVLYDENKFTADALQALTNNLTYTYARCTRSVSIVPAAYYAHLVAFRARYYMEADASDGDSSGTRQGNAAIRAAPATRDNVKAVMFYC